VFQKLIGHWGSFLNESGDGEGKKKRRGPDGGWDVLEPLYRVVQKRGDKGLGAHKGGWGRYVSEYEKGKGLNFCQRFRGGRGVGRGEEREDAQIKGRGGILIPLKRLQFEISSRM